MRDTVIRTEGPTKYYGRHPGIVELDVEVRAGEVFLRRSRPVHSGGEPRSVDQGVAANTVGSWGR
jgi:hypothetical protein